MTENELEAGISVEWVETTEKPFIPKGTTDIFVELTPEETDEYTYYTPEYNDFWNYAAPPYLPSYGAIPEFEDVQKELIINLETTKVKPWEGKLISIGVLDPNTLELQAMNFIQDTEEATLNEFIEWFETTRYTTLIGYNASFDYRWIYVLAQKYRKNIPRWINMEIYDLQQQQKQVKSAFVYGNNPTGTLENWAKYLFGLEPYAEQSKVWDWHKEGNIDEIVNFNTDKLTKAYYLWVLNMVVDGTIPGTPTTSTLESPQETEPTATYSQSYTNPGDKIEVQCRTCLQRAEMLKTDSTIECSICHNPIANPNL